MLVLSLEEAGGGGQVDVVGGGGHLHVVLVQRRRVYLHVCVCVRRENNTDRLHRIGKKREGKGREATHTQRTHIVFGVEVSFALLEGGAEGHVAVVEEGALVRRAHAEVAAGPAADERRGGGGDAVLLWPARSQLVRPEPQRWRQIRSVRRTDVALVAQW